MPLVLDDSTPAGVTHDPALARGAVPRDYAVQPQEMFADPTELPDMSLDEIAQRIEEQNEAQSSLKWIRRRALKGKPIPSLDQNGQGYCWAYSTGMAKILVRARDNQPYVRFSPHAVACKIKNFRDEGGWGGLSAQFARERGYPDEKFWPQKSMSRKYDTPETWANAATHKTEENWIDLAKPVYGQNLTLKQVLTCLVLNNPVVLDFNWWGHSVCGLYAAVRGVRTNYVIQDFGPGVLNSWTDGWGDLGEAELFDSKARPDGAVCLRTETVTAN